MVIHSIMSEHANWTPQGSATYNALKVYPNLFLMLGGHIAGEARRTDVYANNTIHSLLADYQGYPNGGDGWLRILEFVPADNAINVKTYSPKLGQYATEADSQFTLFYEMGGSTFSELATLTGVASETDATYVWPNLEPSRTYQWYASASDGSGTVAGPMRTFQTVLAAPAISLNPTSFDRTVYLKAPLTPDSFTITNTGVGTLDYSIISNAPWLTVSPTSGSLAAQTSEAIQVNYDTVNVPVGNHTAALTVSSATAWNSPQTVGISLHVITVKPDFDADGDVDLSDFGHLQACLSGTNIQQNDPACQDAKLDADSDVDSSDVAIFRRCLSGAGIPADPSCAN